jgi:nitrate/TMAO reductase-like tetraheme cytochrome c subunit
MSRFKNAIAGASRRLAAWCRKPGTILILAAGLVVGGLGSGALASFMVYANSESFCAGACHEMGQLKKEYTGTAHDVNRSGVQATCNDCHVPHGYVPNYLAKLGLVSDVWGHFITRSIDTPEKLEQRRPELARRVWAYMKANDSRECRHCHTTAKMDKEKQTKEAVSSHAKGRKLGQTCIDCHYAISHKEPAGPGPQEMSVQR